MTILDQQYTPPGTSHPKQQQESTVIISFVVGAVGWVVGQLYRSGNPQVRAYYQRDPIASPAPQGRSANAD